MWYLIVSAASVIITLVIANNRNSSQTKALVASYEAKLKAAADSAVAQAKAAAAKI